MNTLFWAIAFAVSGAPAQQTSQQTPQQVKQEIHVERYAYKGIGGEPGPEPVMAGMIGMDGRMGLLNVTGKPFSATETRRTVQMLANGAKIETSDSNQLYRDEQGRTRVEQTLDGRTTTVIMDPVAQYVAILDRAEKTVHKVPIHVREYLRKNISGESYENSEVTRGSVSVTEGKIMVVMTNKAEGPAAKPMAVERLGDKEVNGVTASGTRKTRTIPAGAIGNDRELQLVDESWFSNDLQVVVKSVSSDPRYGETTYQLTNIVRTMQDPALFQIPTDYTVSTGPNMLGK